MDKYTPTTAEVLHAFAFSRAYGLTDAPELPDDELPEEAGQRWLANHERQIAEKTWDAAWERIRASLPYWYDPESGDHGFDLHTDEDGNASEQGARREIERLMKNNPYRRPQTSAETTLEDAESGPGPEQDTTSPRGEDGPVVVDGIELPYSPDQYQKLQELTTSGVLREVTNTHFCTPGCSPNCDTAKTRYWTTGPQVVQRRQPLTPEEEEDWQRWWADQVSRRRQLRQRKKAEQGETPDSSATL